MCQKVLLCCHYVCMKVQEGIHYLWGPPGTCGDLNLLMKGTLLGGQGVGLGLRSELRVWRWSWREIRGLGGDVIFGQAV